MDDGAVLVLYDEDCGICTALAQALAARDVRVAPIGSPAGERWLRDLSPRERYASFHGIDGRGRRRSGGAAVPLVLSALPRGEAGASLARAFPRLTELAYRAGARSRGPLSALLGLTDCATRRRGPSPTSSPAPGRGRLIPPPTG